MPTKSINLDTEQLAYIEDYADDHGLSFSAATRELLAAAIAAEEQEASE
jgi:plasmid stability protein